MPGIIHVWTTAHEIGHTGDLQHPWLEKLDSNGKLVYKPDSDGFPLASFRDDEKRLLFGPPNFRVNPLTGRIYALLIKPEWDRFRQSWNWPQ